ncbi:unnamed protein product [Clavelina lepadiformis]|uniref:Ufm1-specific protease 2 n=1 Tax=Clavelina lepadiformis TaxID=159417 RepID=A0ABP0FY55_CLALP
MKGKDLDGDNIFITDNILQKVAACLKADRSGVLVGLTIQGEILITGCLSCDDIRNTSQIETWLPGGISVKGEFNQSKNNKNLSFSEPIFHASLINDDVIIIFDQQKTKPRTITLTEARRMLQDSTFSLKLVVNMKVDVVNNGRLNVRSENLISDETTFFVPSLNILIKSSDDGEFVKCFPKSDFSNGLEVKIVKSKSSSDNVAPVLSCQPSSHVVYQVPVRFDGLCYVNKDSSSNKIVTDLNMTLRCFLHSINVWLESYNKTSTSLPVLQFFDFNVPGWCHPVSICYPANQSDDDLAQYRRETLHPLFCESCDRPIFRRANSLNLDKEFSKELLVNPHETLPCPKLVDGKVYTVHGLYSYHHYMQDNFNDNGWGCAYRSLQTLMSWFRHQGYTNKPILTHREIQQVLVDVGDKPKEFVGTRKWIGSIEVNNVLSEYLGVTSKIMFVSQGSELEGRGRELAMHFANQGTPVMIGGGVLAHTILGVCFSETSGETRFLILDPHYTGGEDLKTIIDKGWCGWKKGSFWDQRAYYNLCLPQRPTLC